MRAQKRAVPAGVSGLLITTSFLALPGCEVDSWFDPSRTGYFETTPTSMPILRRIDIIEREATGWGPITEPTPEDLEPGELEYRLAAGDQVRIEVYELVTAGQTDVSVRTVDPSGNVRLPTLGEIPAAGLTPSELQVEIETKLKDLINDPIVAVVLERGQGFNFTIYGSIGNTGIYSLTKPDFRVLELAREVVGLAVFDAEGRPVLTGRWAVQRASYGFTPSDAWMELEVARLYGISGVAEAYVPTTPVAMAMDADRGMTG